MLYIVMPAYNPQKEELVNYIKEIYIKISLKSFLLILIDDGSSNDYKETFDYLKKSYPIVILRHSKNLGKGAALKTGFRYIQSQSNSINNIIVTVDSDGQHLVSDLLKIIDKSTTDRFILGSRNFLKTKKVPLRSRVGNVITSLIFKLRTGVYLSDTQTGLRAFHSELITDLLEIRQNGYDYEAAMLIKVIKSKIRITEIAISTVYIQNNNSSHFNPFKDSLKIYATIFKIYKN
ncbi:glycosyltransferase family 2 protein [Lactococcus lactis]|uniref:glycosyltransferase family 2 protein n=1 Tax=Lactococcus lactis TaxID=1358 RepID=UPI0033978206